VTRAASASPDHPELRGNIPPASAMPTQAFAMEQRSKAGRALHRMAEGVTEIEQRPLAGFTFIAGHDRGLARQESRWRVRARRRFENIGVVGLRQADAARVTHHLCRGRSANPLQDIADLPRKG